jgi:hypothetical protein
MSHALTEALVYAATVTVPDDADPLTAASVAASGVGFQALADRTKNLVGRVGGASGAGEFLFVDATGAPATRVRTRIVSPFEFDTHTAQTANGDQSWYSPVGHYLSSINDYPRLSIDLNKYVPNGAYVGLVRAIIAPGAARPVMTSTAGDNGRMWHRLFRATYNFAAGPPPTATYGADIVAWEDDGTTNMQVLSMAFNQVIDKSASALIYQIIGGFDAGTNRDDVHAIEITYADPGPQNF